MNSLDDHILSKIISYLHDDDLFRSRLVSRQWYDILSTDIFWNERISQVFLYGNKVIFQQPRELYWRASRSEISSSLASELASEGDIDMLTILDIQGCRPNNINMCGISKNKIIPLLSWMNDREMLDDGIFREIIELKHPKALDWLEEHGFIPNEIEDSKCICDVDVGNWFKSRGYSLSNEIVRNALEELDLRLLSWCLQQGLYMSHNWFLEWWLNSPIPFILDFRTSTRGNSVSEMSYYRSILERELIRPKHLEDLREVVSIVDWYGDNTGCHVLEGGKIDHEFLADILDLEEFKRYLF